MADNKYGKEVFITGASSGIGLACAEYFAKMGCCVTGVSRHVEESEKAFPGGGRIVMRKLDVTDSASVKAFIEALPRIDIAILCAGMGIAGPAETTPLEMMRRQMDVNYFGTVGTAQCCLSKMKEQRKGLLIVIGSIAGRVSIPMQSQYSASKYALEAFTDAVRMEMKPFGVRASIIEPGDTKTGFTDAREILDDGKYGSLLQRSVAKMAKDEQSGRPPESVAKAAYKLACRIDPPARVPVGFEYKLLMFLLRIIPDRLKEFILTKMYLPK
jgi:NAD(P)-dependent dehydrogenase (short-subunit alcohol dehydrogenase family)